MTRILVTGGSGQVGWDLQRMLFGTATVLAPSREMLDLNRPETLDGIVKQLRPDLIINCAAYTAVDRAETEPQEVQRVNVDAVVELTRTARETAVPFVHFSTDYVFDGLKTSPYTEDDSPNPCSIYGRSKLEGELATQESGAAFWIFRTSWVYSYRGRNFAAAIVNKARSAGALRVVADQVGSPTSSQFIGSVLSHLLSRSIHSSRGLHKAIESTQGVYNLSCEGETTWYDFAVAIICALQKAKVVTQVPIEKISTSDYPTPAKRPKYSVLSKKKISTVFGIELAEWRDAANLCFDQLIEGFARD